MGTLLLLDLFFNDTQETGFIWLYNELIDIKGEETELAATDRHFEHFGGSMPCSKVPQQCSKRVLEPVVLLAYFSKLVHNQGYRRYRATTAHHFIIYLFHLLYNCTSVMGRQQLKIAFPLYLIHTNK